MKDRQLTLLVSPLDWGLGHASRMIPLIGRFIQDGHNVILAASGRSGNLLRNTFPQLKFIPLSCHTIQMGSGKHSYIRLILQVPALIWSVFREHRIVNKIVTDFSVDIVISDNRYGLHCRNATSVLITHQVSPVLPPGFRWLEFPLYFLMRFLVQRFDQCWIPDFADPEINLSGQLSHRYNPPSNARYIGILSRFGNSNEDSGIKPGFQYDVVVVLSGPEPQASLFENLVIRQLGNLNKRSLLIRGLRTKDLRGFGNPRGMTYVSHLEMNAFSSVLKQARLVVSRSGYSGIMDFVALGIPAVLVPTPGQSEQEYLARRLSEKGWFFCVSQEELNLAGLDENLNGSKKIAVPRFSTQPDLQFVDDLYQKYYQDSQ